MKLFSFTVLLLLAIAGKAGAQTSTAKRNLQFDGYYHTLSDTLNPFRFYLRFYPDGTVIGISTAGNPKNLVHWFKKDHQNVSKGFYNIKDTTINFLMKSPEGEVQYNGVMLKDDRLFLQVRSLINKYEGREEYFFMRMDGLK